MIVLAFHPADGDTLATRLQIAESVLAFAPRMTLSPQRSSAWRLLVLLAASYVTFASNVAGHALLGATYRVADEGAPSSSSTPTPVHDQNACRFCQIGSDAFTLGPTQAGPLLRLDMAQAPRPIRTAAPRTPEASPEDARAPPHDLFS